MPATNIAELVEKMPPTDKELQPPPADGQEKPDQPKKARRAEREMQGSKFTGPDPDEAAKICDEILAGGPASVEALISLIRDPGDPEFKNYKAEYLLHCLTLFVGRPEKAAQRRLLVGVLAKQAANEGLNKAVRGFLVRELKWIGDGTTVSALSRLLQDETLCADAAAALVAIADGAPAVLQKALSGTNGPSRLTIIQNLAVLRDPASLATLRKAASDREADVRLAAAWGLARLGDTKSVDTLLKAADKATAMERIKATQACLVLAENLADSGKKNDAAKIYSHLRRTRTDPKELYIQELSTRALGQLGGSLT